jgi:hypothetical protein
MEIKLILISFLILLFSGAWVLSNSELGKRIIMGDRLFLITNIVLFLCSTAGFIITIIIGEEVMSSHIFEILLLPALVAFVLTGISRKQKNAEEHFDEKQQSNMKDAAAFSWMVIIFAMFIIYAVYYAGNLTGLLFFPLIIYIAFGAYSGSLIFFYRIG